MSFTSLGEFLAMGGHGLYVWLAYGAALIIMLYNVITVRVRQRRALDNVRDRMRRHETPPRPAAVVTGETERR